MKKLLSLLLAVTVLAFVLAGCSGQKEEEKPAATDPVDVRVVALKGPTSMGMVKFMDEVDAGEVTDNNYIIQITAAIDEATALVAKGEVDIVAVPANLSSVLYNKTEGGVKVLAINVLGILYIVEKGDVGVESAKDLKGKTIYASGKGASPEYALNYILEANGLDPEKDVTIEWKSEHSEVVASLANSESGLALLPQPFVTTAQLNDPSIHIALDLNAAWDELQAGKDDPSALVIGTLIVRTQFAEEHPEAVNAFLDHYAESVAYVNANNAEAAALIGKYDIVPEAVAAKALPYCNITFIDGDELVSKLGGYLQVLYDANPESVGGAIPPAEFYYSR